MKRWLPRVILALATMFIAVYGGDWLVFKLRGAPTSAVVVRRYLSVPLKGNKLEIDPVGTVRIPCSVSLFPQSGLNPCWQVRRETKEDIPL